MNWYRTNVPREPDDKKTWVIPNFSRIPPQQQVEQRQYDKRDLRILFARRFVTLRGTRIFVQAANRLLDTHSNVSFTFARTGLDEQWLRSQFDGDDRVRFTTYTPDETLNIHFDHDIAVVPSLASEGTSLSVAEAMATGCPVVATGIGGVTNMIINGYNGVLVMPNAQSLHEGIESLVGNVQLRQRIGTRGAETAREAFSLETWQDSWLKVLEQISSQ